MSNETDLDWLARNVHKWQGSERCVSVCNGVIRWTVGSKPMDGLAWFTKHEWLSRRAELQNKPSWKDAPEWAGWLAKDSPDKDEESAWWWYADKPVAMKNTWQVSTDGRAMMAASCHCDLGDWRDTLEKRPEEFKPSIEEANRLAQEFKLFTSIEDNQELIMTQQQDMKQDNKWFERGELPPVGVECDIRHSCWNSEKYEKVTVAAITNEYLIVKYATFEQHYMLKDISFRPIRTERDVLLSIIVEEMNRYDTDDKIADAILAAGFSLRGK